MSSGARAVVDTTISNDLKELRRIQRLVRLFTQHHGLAAPVEHDIQVCLDEILSNIIRHAYADEAPHSIGVRLAMSRGQVVITITDDGQPFDTAQFATASREARRRNKNHGGLGIHFLKNLVDELSYRRDGRFNRLIAKKDISGGTRRA